MISATIKDRISVAKYDIEMLIQVSSELGNSPSRQLIESLQDLSTLEYSLDNNMLDLALEKIDLAESKVISSFSSLVRNGEEKASPDALIERLKGIKRSIDASSAEEAFISRGAKPFNKDLEAEIIPSGFSYANRSFLGNRYTGFSYDEMRDIAHEAYYLGHGDNTPAVYAESPNLSDVSLAYNQSIIISIVDKDPELNTDVFIEQDKGTLSVSAFDANKEEMIAIDTGFISSKKEAPKEMIFNEGKLLVTSGGLSLKFGEESLTLKAGGPNGHTIAINNKDDLVISLSYEGKLIKEKTVYREDRLSELEAMTP